MNPEIRIHVLVITLIAISTRLVSQSIQYDDQSLPSILIRSKDQSIESVQTWEKERRVELLSTFSDHVYGSFPEDGIQVSFEETNSQDVLCGKALLKTVVINLSSAYDTVAIDLLLFLPKAVESAPVFLGLNFYGNHTVHASKHIPVTKGFVHNKPEFNIFNNVVTEDSRGVRAHRWPVQKIIEAGFGLATIHYGNLDPDYDDGFKNGIHSLLSAKARDTSNLSAISAWSYGLSLAMDYFETDTSVDEERVALIGHSRLGKAALWAGAQDVRFKMVVSNNSGCGGAALSRRKAGERLKDINQSFPHWFSKQFHQYNEQEERLPVDQHQLVALIAPRPIYVASAAKDTWADPEGEFLSLKLAGSVYELYGQKSLLKQDFPDLNQPIAAGGSAYHIRSGKHDIMPYDWKQYLAFAKFWLQ